jgi:hypothetical protein
MYNNVMEGVTMENEVFKLYAEPSFFEGWARLFDPAGTLNQYNTSTSPEEADSKAIMSDWFTVGNDIRKVLNNVKGLQSKKE